jgi:hypothetical protein
VSLPSTSYLPTQTPGGFAPTVPMTLPEVRLPISVSRYDGQTRQWVVESAAWSQSTYAQQAMAIGCLFRKGSIPQAPDLGHTYHEVDVPRAKLQQDVEKRTREAEPIKTALARGWVYIAKVEAEKSGGRLSVGVFFYDLTVDPTRRNLLTLPKQV